VIWLTGVGRPLCYPNPLAAVAAIGRRADTERRPWHASSSVIRASTNVKAIEVKNWLAANGWDDVFLDLDPERGIAAGQRWEEALQKAAYRCEAVVALVSMEWLASVWCKSEIDAARLMGKKVIVALIGIDKSRVPVDLTDEQFIDLTGDPQAYRRLKEGLKRAGLDPTSFPFEAGRRPYPGFAYLEEQDAAVFFGRDAQIVRGLDEIRRLVRTGVTRMLVVVGASGSGKSSFLRAGLWPRLKRDDLGWLPLPILRPERAAISGKFGLAQALQQVISEPRFADGIRQRDLPRSRADIQDLIDKTDDGLEKRPCATSRRRDRPTRTRRRRQSFLPSIRARSCSTRKVGTKPSASSRF